MKAMILAAGLGTRLKPLTNHMPKALVKVGDKTLLELVVNKLVSHGFNDIIINAHHFADQIKGYIEEKNFKNVSITISDESDQLLDTGGGLKKAASFFNDEKPFLIHNVDVLSTINLSDLYQYHCKAKALVTLAVMQRTSSRYLLFDQDLSLLGWENTATQKSKLSRALTSDYKQFVFSGVHMVDPKIFKLMIEDGKFSIIDLYVRLSSNHIIKAYVLEYVHWYDMGKKEILDRSEEILSQIQA